MQWQAYLLRIWCENAAIRVAIRPISTPKDDWLIFPTLAAAFAFLESRSQS